MQGDQRNWKKKGPGKLGQSQERKKIPQHTVTIEIPRDLVGCVIGSNGQKVKDFKTRSGVKCIKIDDKRDPAVVQIIGPPENCDQAGWMIQNFVQKKIPQHTVTIEIPKDLAGCVIGRNGRKVNDFKTRSGVQCIKIDGEKDPAVVQIIGPPESCDQAGWMIQNFVENIMGKNGKRMSFRLLNHHDYPGTTFALKRLNDDSVHAPFFELELERADDSYEKNLSHNSLSSAMESKLLSSLEYLDNERKVKDLIPDLWCHFGKVFLKGIDEEDEEKTFTAEELCENLGIQFCGNQATRNDTTSTRKPIWQTKFQEGVKRSTVNDSIFNPDESEDILQLISTQWRYDYQFLPASKGVGAIRFKVWEGIQEPPREVKHLLCEVPLAECDTESTTAWLCRPATTLANGDVIVPTSRYDFRLKLRTGTRYIKDEDITDAEKELADRLTQCKLSNHELNRPEVPERFLYSFYRKSEERMYTCVEDGEKYTILCLDETEWKIEKGHEKEHKQFAIRVIMDSLSEAFFSGEWEPKQILSKLPKFMEFVQNLQKLVFKDEVNE